MKDDSDTIKKAETFMLSPGTYQHSIPKSNVIDCVGKKTQASLEHLGYTTKRYDSADDIEIDSCFDYVWLHGDRYRQDFSVFPNVCSIHTYATVPIQENLDKLEALDIIKLGIPVLIIANMMDEAKKFGLTFDFGLLEKLTGCPVVPISAKYKTGLDQLNQKILATQEKSHVFNGKISAKKITLS